MENCKVIAKLMIGDRWYDFGDDDDDDDDDDDVSLAC